MACSREFDDDDLARLADAILSIARKLSLRSQETGDVIALNGTEVEVIRAVHLNPGSSPTDVASRTGLRRSNISTVLKVLEAQGLVTRERAENDGRGVQLVATGAAIDNLAHVRRAWAHRLRSADDEVLSAAVEARDALERLARALDVQLPVGERNPTG